MIKKKILKKKHIPQSRHKICNRCGSENSLSVLECKNCSNKRFAPPWVLARYPINRQVGVEITRPDPKYGKAPDRITLDKWWPGGSSTFHIPNQAQWESIFGAINNDLGPRIGWKTVSVALEEVANMPVTDRGKKTIQNVFDGRPDIIRKIIESIDPKSLSKKDFETLSNTLSEISNTIRSASVGFRDAFLSVVKKLPSQKQRALEDLSELLQRWSLQSVTNIAQQVAARLDTITLFQNRIKDPRTFEIRGPNSIHRILEREMWLVDERYWIMHSNEPLLNFIGDEMTKKHKKKFGKLRPDFVCGNVDNKLIILELKKPSYKLSVEDLNQLEQYLILAESYSDFSSYEAYLVGNKKMDELQKARKYRSNQFKTLTYSDLLARTKQKYEQFLKSLEK